MRNLGLQLLLLYVLTVAVLGGTFLYSDHRQWLRLAQSYARASRHSLLLRDLRQAVNSLAPATNDGFHVVAIYDSNQMLIVGIPNTSSVQKDLSLLEIPIQIPINSDENAASSRPLATLTFVYSAQYPLAMAFGGAIALLVVFVGLFLRMKKRIEVRQALIIEQRQLEFEQRLALQIAHDIRSPVSAINMALHGLKEMSGERWDLLQSAVIRINDIANDLLKRNRIPSSDTADIRELVKEVYQEKKYEFKDRDGLVLKLDVYADTQFCRINKSHFTRVLSNLVNNAVEALSPSGTVTIATRSTTHDVQIIVSDTGRGIPNDVLTKVGRERISAGKEGSSSGSGLGLLHAKSAVEEMGGSLAIQSRIGRGTIVSLVFPKV
ncbi:MAG: HAMP domain-containing histidine kinase [Bdellovibrionales bacterium]|nr:HAMP domain-containing histidine kinase [Bdellovibrionales bacterium]